jgi:transposase
MREVRKISFKEKSIFIGIDVHKKSWKVCILCEEIEHKVYSLETSASVLGKYLRRNFPGAQYFSVYEAGFCGFWVHEALQSEGINNIVVNPADVPTTDKEKKRKTDGIDCRKLARSLRNGDLSSIYIPERDKQEDRSLVRLRTLMVKDQTRSKNRIKSVLSTFGIIIPEEKVGSHWSKKYIEYLRQEIKKSATLSHTIEFLLADLEKNRNMVAEVTRKIRQLSLEPRYLRKVDILRSVVGISILTAMTLLTEFGDFRKYKRLDKLVSYVGITPDERSSGEKENKLSITKRGNKFLKHVIIEAAWTAVRKDPALMLAYKNYSKRMLKTKAIVKIARKLINRIRFVLLNEVEYKLSTL